MPFVLRHATSGEPIGYFASLEAASIMANMQREFGVRCFISYEQS